MKTLTFWNSTFFSLTICIRAFSQDTELCNCKNDFDFIVRYLENDYAGFTDNVTATNRAAYEHLKDSVALKVLKPLSKAYCNQVLNEYIDFFRDNHLRVRSKIGKAIDEKSEAEVSRFKNSAAFIGRERIEFDSTALRKYLSASSDPIEGIYENEVYEIAIVKNKTHFRDYCGIITKSATPLWEAGQLKLEFKQIGASRFQTILYYRDHSPENKIVKAMHPVSDIMELKRTFTNAEPTLFRQNFKAAPVGKWFQYKELDDSTLYIHVKTFFGALKSKLDSAYQQIKPILERKPYLILDVRDNGGGSDACWDFFSKYLYTQPFENDLNEYYCSPEIVKRNEEHLRDMRNNRKGYGWQAITFQKIKLRKIKKAKKGTFIPLSKMTPWWARPFVNTKTSKQKNIAPFPKKAIVVFNRNSASSAEGLIIEAMKSTKVTTFGKNSGGFNAFGDIREVSTPSGLLLQSATTRIRNRFQYEKIGIEPKVKAQNNSDWIEQARQLLKNMP